MLYYLRDRPRRFPSNENRHGCQSSSQTEDYAHDGNPMPTCGVSLDPWGDLEPSGEHLESRRTLEIWS